MKLISKKGINITKGLLNQIFLNIFNKRLCLIIIKKKLKKKSLIITHVLFYTCIQVY